MATIQDFKYRYLTLNVDFGGRGGHFPLASKLHSRMQLHDNIYMYAPEGTGESPLTSVHCTLFCFPLTGP